MEHLTEHNTPTQDSIDFNKIFRITRKNAKWIVIIILFINLIAYLYLRYTKPVFESYSEIKLDIESDASEFGIGNFFEEKNLSILSGEIELLKSSLFYDKIIDSLDLYVSYYTKGTVLNDEKYPNYPFIVNYSPSSNKWYDRPIYLNFTSNTTYQVSLDKEFESESITYQIKDTVHLDGLTLHLTRKNVDLENLGNEYFFVINSHKSLQNYFESNMYVALLNLKANTLKISIQDNNVYKARDLVNAINTIYINYTKQEKSKTNKSKIEWINKQLSKIEGQLENYENFFEEFTIQNRTSDLNEDLKKTIAQINTIDSNRIVLNSRLKLISELSSQLTEENIVVSSQNFPPEMVKSIVEINDLMERKNQLGLAYKETTFAVRELTLRLKNEKENLTGMISKYINSVNNQLSQLQQSKSNLERNFISIPEKSTEFNKNQRYYDLYEEFYLSLMQSKAEFEIAVAGTTPNFKILANATEPINPIYPNSKYIWFASITISLFSSLLFILGIYITENRINNVEEIEQILPYPNLGSIPKSKIRTDINRMIVNDYPKSGVSEALRTIRTNIQFLIPGKTPKVVTITSTIGGEGKTFLTLNLGAILASSRKRVVIIDLDMRKPQIGQSFSPNVEFEKGISTVLINQHTLEESIVPSNIDNLHYIPSGPIPPNPSELILNGEFERVLEQLRENYDIILLDTPPIGLVTDAMLAMKRSDLTLLTIRASYSKRKEVQSINRLTSFQHSKIAFILNSVESASVYGYNYGYYSEKKS